jgi:hypothetical protein
VFAKVSPSGKRSDRSLGFSTLPAGDSEVVAASSDTAHHFAVVDADPTRLRMVTFALRGPSAPAEPIDEVVITA